MSMVGKRRCQDKILVERQWRTVKYQKATLKAYSNAVEASTELKAFF